MIVTSLLRHLAPIIAVYVTSPDVKAHVATAVTAALAFGWSALEKFIKDQI